MGSVTPPPSSPISLPITAVPQVESAAWFALAIKLLRTKPSSLSISEYFALLRSNTVPGGRSLDSASERRHIEACEFWRKRYEAEATRVIELQARVNELSGKPNTLPETNKVNQAQNALRVADLPQVEGPVKKKAKITVKRADAGKDVKRKTNLGGQKKPQQQQKPVLGGEEDVFDETFSQFSGSSISDLVASLRLLHFVREPYLVSKTIIQSSKALHKLIQDYIDGKLSTLVPSVHLTRGATIAQAKELEGIINFSQAVGKSCDKMLSALSALVARSHEVGDGNEKTTVEDTEFITDGICALIKNMTVILSSIHNNSRSLLFAALPHPPQFSTRNFQIKDIRLELTMLLIRQLTKLDLSIAYQRKVLEGTFYYLLEVIGGVLLRSFISPSKDGERKELLARLAVEETSWYLLRVLEAVLPAAACCFDAGGGKLEDISRERLKIVLVKGFFNDKIESEQATGGMERRGSDELGFWGSLEKSGFGGNICIVDSPFSRVLWELLGLDILAGPPATYASKIDLTGTIRRDYMLEK